LATQGLAKKVVLVLVSGFVVSLLNFDLWDIVFIVTTKALPSWSLIFLMVTNQLSLNTKSSKSLLLTTIIVVEA
jgi:hypothetical protein